MTDDELVLFVAYPFMIVMSLVTYLLQYHKEYWNEKLTHTVCLVFHPLLLSRHLYTTASGVCLSENQRLRQLSPRLQKSTSRPILFMCIFLILQTHVVHMIFTLKQICAQQPLTLIKCSQFFFLTPPQSALGLLT